MAQLGTFCRQLTFPRSSGHGRPCALPAAHQNSRPAVTHTARRAPRTCAALTDVCSRADGAAGEQGAAHGQAGLHSPLGERFGCYMCVCFAKALAVRVHGRVLATTWGIAHCGAGLHRCTCGHDCAGMLGAHSVRAKARWHVRPRGRA